jgi:LysM repeat protein
MKQEGFTKTFKIFEQEWLPSNKTALTIIWIIVSIMAGELIIYKHQNLFSSYVTNASDFNAGASDSREKYDTNVNSTSKLYQNILTRYASEESGKRTVSREVDKIVSGSGAKAVSSSPMAAGRLENADRAAAETVKTFSGANNGRVIVHKVKRGETLAHISQKYYKTVSKYKQIAVQNNLKSPYSVKRGDKLIIVLR